MVPALKRGLAILNMFGRGRRVVTVPDIVTHLDVSRATAFRLAYTLEACGFIERLPNSSAYQLGPRTLAAALEHLHSIDAVDIARPLLDRLRDETGALAQLGVRDGTNMLYIVRSLPADRHRGSPSSLPLARHEAHAVSSGRALLFDLPDIQLATLYADFNFKAFRPPAAQSLDELRQQLSGDRAQGFVTCHAVFTAGVTSVAAPVRIFVVCAMAAVGVSGTSLSTPEAEARARDHILHAAAVISLGLGFHPPSGAGAK